MEEILNQKTVTKEQRIEAHQSASASAEEVLDTLETDAKQGLRPEQIAERREAYGPNRLAEAKPIPAYTRFLAQFRELVIWILIFAAIIAGAMGEWIDTGAILAIVFLNAILGFIQEEKAGRALAALRAMSTPMARVRRGGQQVLIQAEELVPGDIVLLEAGDHVPADCRLTEAFSFSTQEASLTGESVPVGKDASLTHDDNTPVGDRKNSVFMGTVVANGKGTAVVVATGMFTELGKIAGMLQTTQSEATPLQRRLAELGRILAVACLALVAVIFAIQFWRGGAFLETLLVAVSLAVAAVPEGLPAVVTIALALGLQRMVTRNALIRKLPSVETLGAVTVICSDKTGTLTRNEMTVREVHVGDGSYQVTGAGYEPAGEFVTDSPSEQIDGGPHSHDLNKALTIAARCNNAKVERSEGDGSWQVIGDPTEGALVVLARKAGLEVDVDSLPIESEIPFDSERKTMSVILRPSDADKPTEMFTKGAPEIILDKCNRELRNGEIVELTPDRREEIRDQNSSMAKRALRVLAFAFRFDPAQHDGEYQETDLVFVGFAGMIDPPRDEAKTAIAECHRAGIRPVMITGDHPETALAIGRELDLVTDDSVAMTGIELDEMTDRDLSDRVRNTNVYARVTAAHKLRVVKAWKEHGDVVAMTGDGVNDAPAVKAADIGVAMGITGTDVTKEAADMVLTDDNFASIVSAVKEGRGIFDNIQKFVHYLLSCNAGEVMLMFTAALMGLPLPLIAIQILWINLVTDGLPALALAVEPPERDIMLRQPRPPREPVITVRSGLLILYHGSLVAISALFGFWWVYTSRPDSLDVARTAAFAVTALSQLAFALVCRSQKYTLPQLGFFSNGWLFVAFAASGLMQLLVLTLPMTRHVFEVVPMPRSVWLWVLGLSLLPATAIEVAKILRFAWRGRQNPTAMADAQIKPE